MKIVIQDTLTKQYFNKDQWVADVDGAYHFKTTAEAIGLAFQLGLKDFEILHVFGESEHNFSTGVMDFSKPPARAPLPPL
jgi:hypothetical protein